VLPPELAQDREPAIEYLLALAAAHSIVITHPLDAAD
jgi:hypothetical protein